MIDQPQWQHPLAIDPDPKPSIGQPTRRVFAHVKVNPALQLPTERGRHSWIARLNFSVPAEALALGGLPVDTSKIVDVDVWCWVCEHSPHTPEMLNGPCLGDPRGKYIPTRREFEQEWDEDERVAWIEAMQTRHD